MFALIWTGLRLVVSLITTTPLDSQDTILATGEHGFILTLESVYNARPDLLSSILLDT